MTDPRLIFPAAPTEQSGFASADADRASRGYAEPVVRELLQNCLDARRPGGVRVTISLSQVAVSQIPSLRVYRRVLETAISNRTEGNMLSHADKAVVERIKRVLDGEEMWVMICRDDGHGLTKDTMSRLLSEGNTDKSERGAGSIGLGHLTAFGASDLRYVLYGARNADGRIISGRCLLAAHHPQGDEESRSHKGTLALDKAVTRKLKDPPFVYPTEPPLLLQPEMDRISDTGTVVAVLGFNHFGEDDPAQARNYILRTAAAHFAPAICDGRMTVEATLHRGKTRKLDSPRSVGAALSEKGNTNRTERWRFPEAMAHRAWRTLCEGKELVNDVGAVIRFRPLDLERGERNTRVNFFREGMWITNSHYPSGDFSARVPFDAVVLADPERGSRFSELIRNSEGADHYDINLSNLSISERPELREMLKQIKEVLLGEAEFISKESWRPFGFAAFGKPDSSRRVPRPAPPRPAVSLPAPDPGEEAPALEPVDHPEPETHGEGSGPGSTPEPTSPTGENRGPRPGKTASVSLSFRELVLDEDDDDSDAVRALRVAFRLHALGRLGVRVIYATGGDETCDASPRPEFLRVRPGSSDSLGLEPSGEWEVLVPPGCFSFELELSPPAMRSRGPLALDVVERR